ncbi:MAG: glutathione S-transferase family protein [Myxococcota bacterium]
MKVTVFGTRFSPFVEKVVRGLQLKGVPFELIGPKSPTDMKKWNPQTRKMPVVLFDEEKVIDSTFILRRLDELVPEPPLFADDPLVAANQRQLEDWADESLYWYVMAFFWAPKNANAVANRNLSMLPAFLRPLAVPVMRRQIGKMVQAQGLGRLPVETLEKEFGARLDDLLRMLGDRPYFYDERPSVADLSVYGQLSLAQGEVAPETRAEIEERPRLVDYMKRVEQATGGAAA